MDTPVSSCVGSGQLCPGGWAVISCVLVGVMGVDSSLYGWVFTNPIGCRVFSRSIDFRKVKSKYHCDCYSHLENLGVRSY